MSVSDKIKSLLQLKGVKNKDLAVHLGITPQSMRNKFARGSFSAEDLIQISDFLGCKLYFGVDEDIKIQLTPDDLRPTSAVDDPQ